MLLKILANNMCSTYYIMITTVISIHGKIDQIVRYKLIYKNVSQDVILVFWRFSLFLSWNLQSLSKHCQLLSMLLDMPNPKDNTYVSNAKFGEALSNHFLIPKQTYLTGIGREQKQPTNHRWIMQISCLSVNTLITFV